MKNKLVYIISPLRGEVERNVKYAKSLAIDMTMEGYLPIVPHLYFTTFLDDNIEEERNLGMKMGLDILKMCPYYYVGDEFGISSGMKEEIKLANKLNLIKL